MTAVPPTAKRAHLAPRDSSRERRHQATRDPARVPSTRLPSRVWSSSPTQRPAMHASVASTPRVACARCPGQSRAPSAEARGPESSVIRGRLRARGPREPALARGRQAHRGSPVASRRAARPVARGDGSAAGSGSSRASERDARAAPRWQPRLSSADAQTGAAVAQQLADLLLTGADAASPLARRGRAAAKVRTRRARELAARSAARFRPTDDRARRRRRAAASARATRLASRRGAARACGRALVRRARWWTRRAAAAAVGAAHDHGARPPTRVLRRGLASSSPSPPRRSGPGGRSAPCGDARRAQRAPSARGAARAAARPCSVVGSTVWDARSGGDRHSPSDGGRPSAVPNERAQHHAFALRTVPRRVGFSSARSSIASSRPRSQPLEFRDSCS